jgi:hypothetical protein
MIRSPHTHRDAAVAGGTAAANASTPAAKMDPAGAKPSSPKAGDPAATNNK